MPFQVQDQQFKRILDFLGLRGEVNHGYVEMVTPVVSVGDFSQQVITQRVAASTMDTDLWLVPRGETWRPIMIGGFLTQSGGAVAPRWSFRFFSGPAGSAINVFPLPTFFGSSTTFAGPALGFTAVLNFSTDVVVQFPKGFLMPAGSRIQVNGSTGNGTLLVDNEVYIMYVRLAETLLEAR